MVNTGLIEETKMNGLKNVFPSMKVRVLLIDCYEYPGHMLFSYYVRNQISIQGSINYRH